jgi:Acetyltransferase (GNAT) domain
MGYLVLENEAIVGTCAFRSPPQNGEVEIAYFTFPEFEGRGFATEMGRRLIQIVKDTEPGTRILRLPCLRKTLLTVFCRNWDSVSRAKRVTKMGSSSGDGNYRQHEKFAEVLEGRAPASPALKALRPTLGLELVETARPQITVHACGSLDATTVDGQKCACSVDRKSRQERK